MSHYVSSYHANRKKQIMIQTIGAVAILAVVAVIIWVVFGKDASQNAPVQTTSQAVQQKPAAPLTDNKPAQPAVAASAAPQPLNPQPAQAAPAAQVSQAPSAQPAIAQISQPNSPALANPSADAVIKNALALINTNPIAARDSLNQALKGNLSPQQVQEVKTKMTSLADYWLFSRKVFANDPLCGTYTIKPGDMLVKIAPKFKIPHELIMQINGIKNPNALIAGQNIKVVNGPFRVNVNRTTFTIDVYLQDTYVRSFKGGLGIPGRETPTGFWVVKYGGKAIQPQWYDRDINKTFTASDPDYPLGTRWIELQGLQGNAVGQSGIAFHGTNEPQSIGTRCSRGCVRMINSDVEILYNLLEPGESNVTITD